MSSFVQYDRRMVAKGTRAQELVPATRRGRLTRGAKKLLRLLKQLEISYSQFAKIAGVSRLQLHRVLTGMTRQISVDFAMAIDRACKEVLPPGSRIGGISVQDFSSSTIGEDESVDRSSTITRRRPAARRTTSAVQV